MTREKRMGKAAVVMVSHGAIQHVSEMLGGVKPAAVDLARCVAILESVLPKMREWSDNGEKAIEGSEATK